MQDGWRVGKQGDRVGGRDCVAQALGGQGVGLLALLCRDPSKSSHARDLDEQRRHGLDQRREPSRARKSNS